MGKGGHSDTCGEKLQPMWLNPGYLLVWDLLREGCFPSQILAWCIQTESHLVTCAGQELHISKGTDGYLRVYVTSHQGFCPLYRCILSRDSVGQWSHGMSLFLTCCPSCFPRVHDVHRRATLWEVGPVYRRYPPIWKYAKPSQEEQGQLEEFAPQATQQ